MRFITFLLLVFSYSISAQSVKEVEYSLDTIQNVNDKITFLNKWTGKNYRSKPNEAEYYALKTIKLAQESENFSGIGNAYIRIGSIYKRKAEYDTAIIIYNRAIENFTVASDSAGINLTYLNRGLALRKISKFDLALKDFYSVLNYYDRNYDAPIKGDANNGIGLIYKELKNYDKALKYYKRSAELYLESNYISSLYAVNNNIAVIFSLQNKFKEALSYYNKNLNVLEKKPNNYKLAQTYHNIGNCFLVLKQYTLAIEYFQKSLSLKKSIGNKDLITTSLNSLANTYIRLQKYNKALAYSKNAYQFTLETSNIYFRKTSSKDLFKIYTHLQEPDSAMQYFMIYEQLKDSILNLESLSRISLIQTKYETHKKESQISFLKNKNKNNAMQRNGLIIILILIIAYAAFIVKSYYRNKKITRILSLQKSRIEWSAQILNQKNKALETANQTKNKLFQIISHDLRSPLATVSGISQLISIYIKQGKYDKLNNTSKDLEESVTRVLNLTDNLLSWSLNQSNRLPFNPLVLSANKLLIGISETYQSVAKHKNIYLEVSNNDKLSIYGDRSMLETVIRNLINNAIKFTPEGGVILIGAIARKNKTEVYVKDSGSGIPKNQHAKLFELKDGKSTFGTKGEKGNGLGLILCKDFIERHNGEIWVESKENIGSTFRFSIPCKPELNKTKSDDSKKIESDKLESIAN